MGFFMVKGRHSIDRIVVSWGGKENLVHLAAVEVSLRQTYCRAGNIQEVCMLFIPGEKPFIRNDIAGKIKEGKKANRHTYHASWWDTKRDTVAKGRRVSYFWKGP